MRLRRLIAPMILLPVAAVAGPAVSYAQTTTAPPAAQPPLPAPPPPVAAPAPPPPPAPTYPAAPAPMPMAAAPEAPAAPPPPPPPEGLTMMVSKWQAQLYGFVDADSIYDTTRTTGGPTGGAGGFNEASGNALVPRPNTGGVRSVNGNNPSFTMGIRNSRFGFRVKAPEVDGVKTSAQMEIDGLGAAPADATEATMFSNSYVRVRHFNLKVETPVVDILFGQYWSSFGFQTNYFPTTVQVQGIPGELFLRTPQLRLSKTIKADPISIDIVLAAQRAFARADGLPDGIGGLRIGLDSWKGVQTQNAASTVTSPLSIAASGLIRQVSVNQYPSGAVTTDVTASAVSIDAFIPIISGSKEKKDNSFALNGEFTTGTGYGDQFTNGGMGINMPANQPLPGGATACPAAGKPVPANCTNPVPYVPGVDNGIATWTGTALGETPTLRLIPLTTYLIGAQYYLPGVDGKVFIAGNYSHVELGDSLRKLISAASATSVASVEDFFDAMLFVDPFTATRFGLEYANMNTQFVDGSHAINHRVQLSGFFIF